MRTSNKATRSQVRLHNRQLILRAVHAGVADNRAALALETGLAKPTVSDLIAELMDEGLLIEVGRGKAAESGGKPPRLLEFVPDSRHVIGVSISEYGIDGLLTNLNGDVLAEHRLSFEESADHFDRDNLTGVINGLIAQIDAPLLCIGVGVPGNIDPETGLVHFAPALGWHPMALGHILETHYDLPIYIENNTELVAIAQFAFEANIEATNLVTVLVNSAVEIGYVLGDTIYHGGQDIGWLKAGNASDTLEKTIGWGAVKRRARQLKQEYPDSLLPSGKIYYLDIRYGVIKNDHASMILYEEITRSLAEIFMWTIALLKPDHIVLAGGIGDLGYSVMGEIRNILEETLPRELLKRVQFSLATDNNLNARGAMAYALQQDLGLVQWHVL